MKKLAVLALTTTALLQTQTAAAATAEVAQVMNTASQASAEMAAVSFEVPHLE